VIDFVTGFIVGAAVTAALIPMFWPPVPAYPTLPPREPPEMLDWEEHVEKYGNIDGRPMTDEEVDIALGRKDPEDADG
jgi:hypothetical protein